MVERSIAQLEADIRESRAGGALKSEEVKRPTPEEYREKKTQWLQNKAQDIAEKDRWMSQELNKLDEEMEAELERLKEKPLDWRLRKKRRMRFKPVSLSVGSKF